MPKLECFNCKYIGNDWKQDKKKRRWICPKCNKLYLLKLKCQKCDFHGFFEHKSTKKKSIHFNDYEYYENDWICPECKMVAE